MDRAHHAEQKGNSGKATESGFPWEAEQESGRLRGHFSVRKGDPREQDGGKEERVQEGRGASRECALGAGHGLVTNLTGWSISQDCPLRSRINNSFSARSFRGEEEENVSTGSHELRVTHRALTAEWMLRLIALMSREAPKARSVGPEARGQRPLGCAWVDLAWVHAEVAVSTAPEAGGQRPLVNQKGPKWHREVSAAVRTWE